MSIVLRVNGNEPYYKQKITKAKAKQLEMAGHISGYNHTHGYVEGDYPHSTFEHKGIKYKLEYFSGCFYPFLLQLIPQNKIA